MNTAVIPAEKLENDFYEWYDRHEEKCRAAAAHRYDVVFIGDSITHFFEWEPVENRGKEIWKKEILPFNALNLGFGWDRTQNVLWRLENGEFAGQTPKLVVLLIGTNNLSQTPNARANTPAEIVAGVAAICDRIQQRSPRTTVLILGVLPRDLPGSPFRLAIAEINRLLPALADGTKRRLYADIGAPFLRPDGTIPVELMNDLTHPTTAGYRIYADGVLPYLRQYAPQS